MRDNRKDRRRETVKTRPRQAKRVLSCVRHSVTLQGKNFCPRCKRDLSLPEIKVDRFCPECNTRIILGKCPKCKERHG